MGCAGIGRVPLLVVPPADSPWRTCPAVLRCADEAELVAPPSGLADDATIGNRTRRRPHALLCGFGRKPAVPARPITCRRVSRHIDRQDRRRTRLVLISVAHCLCPGSACGSRHSPRIRGGCRGESPHFEFNRRQSLGQAANFCSKTGSARRARFRAKVLSPRTKFQVAGKGQPLAFPAVLLCGCPCWLPELAWPSLPTSAVPQSRRSLPRKYVSPRTVLQRPKEMSLRRPRGKRVAASAGKPAAYRGPAPCGSLSMRNVAQTTASPIAVLLASREEDKVTIVAGISREPGTKGAQRGRLDSLGGRDFGDRAAAVPTWPKPAANTPKSSPPRLMLQKRGSRNCWQSSARPQSPGSVAIRVAMIWHSVELSDSRFGFNLQRGPRSRQAACPHLKYNLIPMF